MIAGHLHALAKRLYGAKKVDGVFAPMLADLALEWEAASHRGRWPALAVLIAGHWHFARTVGSLAWEDGRDRLRWMPWLVLLPALVTSLVGVSLLRDPAGLAGRQAIHLAVASVLMLAAALAPRRWLVGGRVIFAGAGVALLALVAMRGISYAGATRWTSIGGLQVLPGELVRPLLLVALAGELDAHARLRSRRALVGFLVVAALFVAPVALQPDRGVTLVLLATVAGVAWTAPGARWLSRIVTTLSAGGAVATLAGAPAGALDGDADAARHTDLVLDAVRERAGLAGAVLLVAVTLSTVWVVRGATRQIPDVWREAPASRPDLFSRAIVAGFSAATVVQTALHVLAAWGILPQLGLALPTVSYGGSSLVAHWVSLGLVAGVVLHARERRIAELSPSAPPSS